MGVSLISFSDELAALAERAAGPVVAVHGRARFHSSGIHWAPGLIVTADHALRTDEDVRVTRGGEEYTAEVVGRDGGTDIAVLRVKGECGAPVVARGGGWKAPRPGSLALAVGRNTESVNAELGVVSSVGGAARSRMGGKLDAVVRLDVGLHPVSAGGAVVDAGGGLIGMATPALSRVAVLAVPEATIARVCEAIVERGGVASGYLGAGFQRIALPAHRMEGMGKANRAGLMTLSVDEEAPAGRAGLMIGDVLIEWNGAAVDGVEELRMRLAESAGKTAEMGVLRGGEMMRLRAEVEERRPGRR